MMESERSEPHSSRHNREEDIFLKIKTTNTKSSKSCNQIRLVERKKNEGQGKSKNDSQADTW